MIETLVEADGARVAEAAESLDVAPSIAYDHLQTLRSEGYVLNKGGLYYLSDQYL
ncbi:helix-turn-helix domain-containing protein [Halostagnicola kamekurae]|uniref:helix-turn-helix domain-containing protein n=1 Tax=Halostagnicola kamekurae TaxID=619731 RepID=UPI001587B152|nr:helix-turn-helix domain-containing protein [Halostagnicola kamekurae]